jgi:hypothetical protein
LKYHAGHRLIHAVESRNIEQLCELFNIVSEVDIQDIREDIWLSFPKERMKEAIEMIPDIDMSIGYFIDEYMHIGERGREYLAEAGLFSQYEEWVMSRKQGELPKSLKDALKFT